MTHARHTHQVIFGRRVDGCPRCKELDAGAPPIVWASTRRAEEEERLATTRQYWAQDEPSDPRWITAAARSITANRVRASLPTAPVSAPTYHEIANSWTLWMDHIDPAATMTEAEFLAMSCDEKLEIIIACNGPETDVPRSYA